MRGRQIATMHHIVKCAMPLLCIECMIMAGAEHRWRLSHRVPTSFHFLAGPFYSKIANKLISRQNILSWIFWWICLLEELVSSSFVECQYIYRSVLILGYSQKQRGVGFILILTPTKPQGLPFLPEAWDMCWNGEYDKNEKVLDPSNTRSIRRLSSFAPYFSREWNASASSR